MTCPVCHVALTMTERQGIEIDYCPQCRGVWLDRGELDKIIERSYSAAAPPPQSPQSPSPEARFAYDPRQAPPPPSQARPPEYRDRRRDDDDDDDDDYRRRGGGGRRKSWLEDLFD